jgi:hypothetical protein
MTPISLGEDPALSAFGDVIGLLPVLDMSDVMLVSAFTLSFELEIAFGELELELPFGVGASTLFTGLPPLELELAFVMSGSGLPPFALELELETPMAPLCKELLADPCAFEAVGFVPMGMPFALELELAPLKALNLPVV